MVAVLRAAHLAPSERADAFVDLVCESIVPYGDPVGVVVRARDEVHTADVGTLRIMTLGWTDGALARGPKHLRRSDPEMCKIDVSFSGRFAVEQSDRQASLDAGSFSLVDLSRPHRVAARQCQLTAVMFPRALLPLRERDISELVGTTFDRTQPGAALVTSVVREMTDNLSAYEGATGARLGAVVLDLIAVTLAGRVNRSHALPVELQRRALVLRVRAFIEQNLHHPGLGPTAISASHHISRRFLHKLFEDQGTTVAGLIRARRLERCRQDLLDPGQAANPVSAIANRWGYRDPAYFNRVFRAEYGLPPAEYRRVAADATQLATRRR